MCMCNIINIQQHPFSQVQTQKSPITLSLDTLTSSSHLIVTGLLSPHYTSVSCLSNPHYHLPRLFNHIPPFINPDLVPLSDLSFPSFSTRFLPPPAKKLVVPCKCVAVPLKVGRRRRRSVGVNGTEEENSSSSHCSLHGEAADLAVCPLPPPSLTHVHSSYLSPPPPPNLALTWVEVRSGERAVSVFITGIGHIWGEWFADCLFQQFWTHRVNEVCLSSAHLLRWAARLPLCLSSP